ncbi:MAG: hypothetical protein V1740_03730 [Candidatus Woesearchaeota archaeon]
MRVTNANIDSKVRQLSLRERIPGFSKRASTQIRAQMNEWIAFTDRSHPFMTNGTEAGVHFLDDYFQEKNGKKIITLSVQYGNGTEASLERAWRDLTSARNASHIDKYVNVPGASVGLPYTYWDRGTMEANVEGLTCFNGKWSLIEHQGVEGVIKAQVAVRFVSPYLTSPDARAQLEKMSQDPHTHVDFEGEGGLFYRGDGDEADIADIIYNKVPWVKISKSFYDFDELKIIALANYAAEQNTQVLLPPEEPEKVHDKPIQTQISPTYRIRLHVCTHRNYSVHAEKAGICLIPERPILPSLEESVTVENGGIGEPHPDQRDITNGRKADGAGE